MYLKAEMAAQTSQDKEIGWPSSSLQNYVQMGGFKIICFGGHLAIIISRSKYLKPPMNNMKLITYELQLL